MLNLFILAEGSSIPGYILVGVLAIVVGIILAWLGMGAIGKNQIKEAELKSKGIIKDAELQAENKIKTAQLEGKAEQIKMREEFERETAKVRNELRDTEKHLSKKEDSVDRKWESLNSKEKNLDKRENKLGQREKEIQSKDDQLNTVLQQQRAELLKISGISVDQAKEMLLERLESDVTHEASAMIENIVGRAKDEAESRSREITLNAIQRYAASHTCDYTVSTVDIPSDDMKGRVIGREGRNIRAFEKATGVDVIIDDTPGVVVVSAFDPVRREIARLSLEKTYRGRKNSHLLVSKKLSTKLLKRWIINLWSWAKVQLLRLISMVCPISLCLILADCISVPVTVRMFSNIVSKWRFFLRRWPKKSVSTATWPVAAGSCMILVKRLTMKSKVATQRLVLTCSRSSVSVKRYSML